MARQVCNGDYELLVEAPQLSQLPGAYPFIPDAFWFQPDWFSDAPGAGRRARAVRRALIALLCLALLAGTGLAIARIGNSLTGIVAAGAAVVESFVPSGTNMIAAIPARG